MFRDVLSVSPAAGASVPLGAPGRHCTAQRVKKPGDAVLSSSHSKMKRRSSRRPVALHQPFLNREGLMIKLVSDG